MKCAQQKGSKQKVLKIPSIILTGRGEKFFRAMKSLAVTFLILLILSFSLLLRFYMFSVQYSFLLASISLFDLTTKRIAH